MSLAREAAQYWDTEIAHWIDNVPLSDDSERWLRSYQGGGEGLVDLSVFPEPYVGTLNPANTPALVMLGLNPGLGAPAFQGREGIFTNQVRQSSYSQWASSAPYTSEAWESVIGRNKYQRDRLSFARRLHDDDTIQAGQLLFMELYPFHSKRVTGPITPPLDLLESYVFGPLAELAVNHVFAFGKPWLRAARRLGLGDGEDLPVMWTTPSRIARSYVLPGGQSLIVMGQNGYAGPPGREDTALLRTYWQPATTTYSSALRATNLKVPL